jgi:hypothetical protein
MGDRRAHGERVYGLFVSLSLLYESVTYDAYVFTCCVRLSLLWEFIIPRLLYL